MFPCSRPQSTVTRRIALTVFAVALLLPPTPLPAQEEPTCAALAEHLDGVVVLYSSLPGVVPGAPDIQIEVRIAEDGSAAAHGVLHLADEDPPAVLVATGEAEVTCDSLGITSLQVPVFQPSRAHVRIFNVSNPASPIHASGDYKVDLTLTGETTIVMTGVKILVKVLAPGRAATREEGDEATAAAAAPSAGKDSVKGKLSDQHRAKGGKASKGKQGKRRR
jgi:hypothetical protein